jgi:hypothetical protein
MISFWLDHWMGDGPICMRFPMLYELAVNQKCSVYEVAEADRVIRFKIRFPPIIRDQWYSLASLLNEVNLSDNKDSVRWKWTSNKQFSMKLVYLHLTSNENGMAYSEIWKAKIPPKIKIFMWMVAQRAMLTKDNMIDRNWQGDPGCYFCGEIETVDHLLFQCPISIVWGVLAIYFNQRVRPSSYEEFWLWIKRALPGGDDVYMLGFAAVCWAIWSTPNSICFEKKEFKNPCEIIFLACLFIRYWSGLYTGVRQELIEKGIQTMIRVAMKILEKASTSAPRLLLTASEAADEEQDKVDGPGDQAGQ